MVVFRCVKKLPELGSFFPEEYWELSQDEIEEAHQWNLSILPVVTHPCLKASKAWMLAQVGEEETARLIFQDIESDWRSLETLFQFQKSVLCKMDFGQSMQLQDLVWCLKDCSSWEDAFPKEMKELRYLDGAMKAWLWTSRELYPTFIDLATERRLHYELGSSRPRRFKCEETGEWLQG